MSIVHFNDLNKNKITKEEFEIFKKQTFQQYIDSINELLEPYYEEIKLYHQQVLNGISYILS